MTWNKLAVSGLTVICLLIIWKTHQIWAAAFLGVLFALSLNGAAAWIYRYFRTPRWLATLLAMVVVLVTLTGLSWLIGSPLATQFDVMLKELPAATQKVYIWVDQYSWGRRILQRAEDWSGISSSSLQVDGNGGIDAADGIMNDAMEEYLIALEEEDQQEEQQEDPRPSEASSPMPDFSGLLVHIAGALSLTAKTGMLLLLSIVVMLFVAFDPHVYQRGVLWLIPKQHENIASQTMDRLCVALQWWMAGRLASMTAVGVLTTLGMWIIGMPAPLALGTIAGLLSFIPNIGPIVAAIPGLLLAIAYGPWMVLWAACIYLAAQLVESSAITPLVEQYAIAVPPGVLILTQFIFAALSGVWGMIISTPVLVVVMVLVQQLYINQVLEKHIEVTGTKIEDTPCQEQQTEQTEKTGQAILKKSKDVFKQSSSR